MTRHSVRSLGLALAVAIAAAACSTVTYGPIVLTTATPAPSVASGGADCPTAQPEALPAGETRTVTISTELGSMTLKVEADLSPIAAGNFVALAGCGYYDGVVFHRAAHLEDGTPFVIQGGAGGPDGGGPGYTIKDEPVTAQYGRGVVAMARSDAPDSVGSQFFIVLDDGAREVLAFYNTYQIIGKVTTGMETADAIYAAARGVEIPSTPVAMTKVTVSNP
jgi:peptidyl-prolyl cis-trans isomerase B (cyclophilin B)